MIDLLDDIEEEDETEQNAVVELPAYAQINYFYDFSTHKEGTAVRFTTYKNYSYLIISNIPAVPEVTIELDEVSAENLNHPDKWIK